MARPRARWSFSAGEYGAKVRIYEPRLGAPLRWDYREGKERRRPEVTPELRIRSAPDAAVDPVAADHARTLCKQKVHELGLAPVRQQQGLDGYTLTLTQAYLLYFAPARAALPRSASARKHHDAARAFWLEKLGADRVWNTIPPADVRGALIQLRQTGQVQTAVKRLQCLRTMYRWLHEQMRVRAIEDPTLGIEAKQLREGYQVRRPRYSAEEVERLVEASAQFGPRLRLFVTLLADSGARGGQVRLARRSGFNAPLEPPPPADIAPHGWLLLPAVKGQDPMLTFLTARARAALDEALATYLAPWEAEGGDYPLIPSGRVDRDQLVKEPISDGGLRREWAKLEKAAKIDNVSRRTFHGVRRAWADSIEQTEGMDTATAAGGWSRRDTLEETYLSKRRYPHLEKARRRREGGE